MSSADYIPPGVPLYLTPSDIPAGRFCRTLRVPDDATNHDWLAIVDGALSELMLPAKWRETGTLTPEECAEAWSDMMYDSWGIYTCVADELAPYWDDPQGDDIEGGEDSDDGSPWYYEVIYSPDLTLRENVEDWVIAAFVAIASTPASALFFLTLAPKFRLAWRTGDFGGIVEIFVDAVSYGTVDTYSASPGITYMDVVVPTTFSAFAEGDPPVKHEIMQVYNGDHNPAAVPVDGKYQVQFIRKRLYAAELESGVDVRQNEETPCILEKTYDGESWVEFADLTLCPPTVRVGANGQLEYSYDGGTTWQDVPTAPPTPRTPGDPDNTCLAAANAANVFVSLHYEVVTAYLAAAPLLGIAVAVVAFILAVTGLPLAAVLVSAELGAILSYVSALTLNSFTTETKEELICIFLANATDVSGVVTFDYPAVRTAVQANSGVADIWALLYIYLGIVGEDGLNNAGATTELATADCSDCEDNDCPEGFDWCYVFDFTLVDGFFTPATSPFSAGTQPSWVNGVGWIDGVGNRGFANENQRTCKIGRLMPAMPQLTYVRMDAIVNQGTNVPSFANNFDLGDSGAILATTSSSFSGSLLWEGTRNAGSQNWYFGGSTSYRNDSSTPNGDALITKIEFRGMGTNPFI